MKDFLSFLTAVALLALVQAITAALSTALLVLALMAAVVFPRQTLALMCGVSLLATATGAPAASAAAIGAAAVAIIIVMHLSGRGVVTGHHPQLLLTDQRDT